MARDYAKLLRGEGIFVPRWALFLLVSLGVLGAALRILAPPGVELQRLDSPDGRRSAQLLRTQYLKNHFTVRVRSGGLWQTVYYSAPLTNDYRVDLGERLAWGADSKRVCLRLQSRWTWGYDFEQDRDLTATELEAGPGGPASPPY